MQIDKIPELLLRGIRQAMGGNGPQDTKYDELIETLSIDELISKWSLYLYEDEGYGSQILHYYKILTKINGEAIHE